MEQPTAAEQRAFAVAKLKRAASLPRMKDGRRPPMHVEAVSEGERSQLEKNEADPDGQDEEEVEPRPEDDSLAVSDGQDVEWVGDSSLEQQSTAKDAEVKPEEPSLSPPATPLPSEDATAPKSKRRSRSRSRGRTSKDFKGKARNTQSPLPTSNLVSANDSSPDEGPFSPATHPNDNSSNTPLLVSPTPSHFALLQAQRMFASPEPGGVYPGTSPPTPVFPTLQDLQRGLFRSNSAAARMMVMHHLAVGTDAFDTSLGSPSATPPPMPGKIFRNNTVTGSGGERSAARKNMLSRLGNRQRLKEVEAEQTSGGEEPPAPPLPRRKRRSRRSSTNRSTVVDDREPPTAISPTTPIIPTSTPPLSPNRMPEPPHPPSGARSPTPSARRISIERSRETTLAKLMGESPSRPLDYESAIERRGVVVEEEDDAPDPVSPPRPAYNGLPSTPPRVAALRTAKASDAPSSTSTDSGDVGVPVYLSDTIHRHQDMFPTSPFATPLREKSGEDEEEIYHRNGADSRRPPWNDAFDREISWVADPVPESRIPVHDDDEYDEASDTDEQEDHRSVHIGQRSDDADEDDETSSPRASSDSKDLVVERETSPEPTTFNLPPSPSSVLALDRQRSDDSAASSRFFPTRLSVASPVQPELSSPNPEYSEWEDQPRRVNGTDTTPKKNGDNGVSKWDKVKNTLMRTGSSQGRRSRTNSIRERNPNTDSSVSRESGASLTSSSRTDKELSVASYFPSSPGAVSPVPPATTETLLKYTDAKLFPFPGMIRLEEERNRARGLSLNASSPDIVFSPNSEELSAISSGSSRTPQPSPEAIRDRKLSHQASDTRLLAKFNTLNSPGPMMSSPSQDYLSSSPSPTNGTGWLNGKLPMNREGVKKWLSAKKLFPSQSSQPSYPSLQVSPPAPEAQPGSADVSKKPSLSDVLKGRKENDLMADWEDLSKTPTSASGSTLLGRGSTKESRESVTRDSARLSELPATEETPQESVFVADGGSIAPNGDVQYASYALHEHESLPSPPEQALSPTPDPMSSLDDYPTRSSTSTLSSAHSPEPVIVQSQGSIVLERLDEALSRGSRSVSGASLIDEAPRKLLLSSPVLQVANSNTVKDRFLFLFNDILVIAKPITQDYDSLLDATKPSPLDRKFIVKSVVQLRCLRFTSERDDLPVKASASAQRHPVVQTFIVQFTKDPDRAIANFFSKTQTRDDPVILGQLLFKTLDLDRARLGDYLSRRTSKVVLRAYFEGFGFGGLRVDKALRVFLQSIHIPSPSKSTHMPPLDYVIDAFASRWYEANTGIVAYDKDLAVRLVRALVQLNEVLHGGIVHDPWNHPRLKRNVTSRDFIDAFRRYDARCLVSDDLLDKIYTSIKRDPISQARDSANSNTPDLLITIKRPVPARLTYRMQSEPVVLRIPQVDPSLTIHLYGQDLIFDPPYLTFTRSAEASFRITGTSLGSKTITFSRSGATALLYTGLPLSNHLVVERSFMRNTFQLAFTNHEGEKRRYMFSVDDPVMRHNWTVSLMRQIEIATASEAQRAGPSRFNRAAEQTAFRVLQETLIPTTTDDSAEWGHHRGFRFPAPPSPLPGSPSPGPGRASTPNQVPVSPRNSRLNGLSPSHARSKSRSQVYPRHGPGKLEHQQLDLLLSSPNGASTEFPKEETEDDELGIENLIRLWSGKDLEIVCQQNSAIVLALVALQVGVDAEQLHSTVQSPPRTPLPVS